MQRRSFVHTAGLLAVASQLPQPAVLAGLKNKSASVRLGGPVFGKYEDPGKWVALIRAEGYRAAYCPVEPGDGEILIKAYEKEARKQDIVISEVGTWSNTISPDQAEADLAMEKCIRGLELAEQIGARCCVNISGSRNKKFWAGPHEDNLTPAVFDMVVENTRKIIDAVNPKRTFFALEAMPWAFPDSTETYLRLLDADRPTPVRGTSGPGQYDHLSTGLL